MEDSLLKKYFPRSINRGLLERQLYDRELMQMNLDELAEMDVEELVRRAFLSGIAQEEDEAPEAAALSCDGTVYAEPGTATVLVDGMGVEAKIILNKPREGSPAPGEAELRRALKAAGVTHGILDEFVTRLALRPIYDRRFKIAQGALPVDGSEGRVIYHFDTSADLTPKLDKNGNADYRSLDFARNVRQGDLLCEIIPPTPGADGFSVYGEVLAGKSGAAAEVMSGSNTHLSEDKGSILASCDGRAHLKGNKVMVSRVLTVDRVDASTGNILFVGAVEVRGDVAPGFTIRAGGDITVGGVAENATLVSGGNIILCGGIKGKDGGYLEASGSLRTLFIENAKVRVKENIYADSILNSQVECGQTVSIGGVNGCLHGGKCVAGKSVQAREIGNNANIPTTVCLQEVESLASRKAAAALKLAKYRETVERLRMVAELAAQNGDPAVFPVMLARIVITKQRMECAIRAQGTQIGRASANVVRTVLVRETLFPNVTVEIDGEHFRSVKARSKCALVRSGNKVIITSDRFY